MPKISSFAAGNPIEMTNNPLLQFGNLPIESKTIEACYKDLKAPIKKVQSLEKAGDIVRLRRGLYVVSPELSGKCIEKFLCANHIYEPSYISLHWALWWYGLIPELVYTMTSITTKRSHLFKTAYGRYEYRQVTPTIIILESGNFYITILQF